MAFWQYSFWAVPRQSLIKQYGAIPVSITEDEFNDVNWFDDSYQLTKFIESINYLQKSNHWDKGTLFFGDYDADCIAIMLDNGVANEINIRIDLRNQGVPVLDKIAKSLSENDLIIIDESMGTNESMSDAFIHNINIDIQCKNNFFKDK